MSSEKPVGDSTSPAKRFVLCKGCQKNIYFDQNKKSKSGKFIPLNEDGSAHNCPARQQNIPSGRWAARDHQTASNTIGQDFTAKLEKIMHEQSQLRTEIKVGLDHVSQRLNTLQYELQKLQTQGRP